MRYFSLTRKGFRQFALWGGTALFAALTALPLAAQHSYAQAALPSLAEWQEAGFTPKVDTSADRTTSGATRTVVTAVEVAALIPEHNLYGVTVRPDPNLMVYLAEAPADRLVYVVLEDAASGEFIYEQEFLVEGRSGLLNLQLPTSANGEPLLQPGQDYRWEVTLYDDAIGRSVAGVVAGYISYVARDGVDWTNPEMLTELAQLSPYEQGRYLLSNYIWYDGVAALSQAYQTNPIAVEADLQTVLAISGLDEAEIQELLAAMANDQIFLAAEPKSL
ncbi:MAG: DUF928 domain-containing protein [Cyanobacteria bacterium P01_G01_bin.54]